jgi:hypothetical protein
MSVREYRQRSGRKRGVQITLLFLAFLLLASMRSPLQLETSREYQLKAAFLYNFTQFVEWPEGSLPENTPFVIGILGNDPFGNYLDELVNGENVNGHPLIVQRFASVDEIKTCHILFINVSDKSKLQEILKSLKSDNVLTVGDATHFSRNGGIVRFYTEDNKTRIHINLEAAKQAELTISTKLLRLAGIVDPQLN